MAIATKNKETRGYQENSCHAAGSRSFAVIQDQMEIKEGRTVSRSELYCVVHTNKKGEPVDAYSAGKMVEIKEQLKQDPSLIGEQPHDGDLYSTLFPKARKTRMHGLGLLVGGKKSERLDQAIVALRESTEENLQLRSLVEKLVASQNCLMARSQQMEEKLNLVLASKKLETSQEKTKDAEKELQDPTNKMEDNCEVKEVKEQLPKEVKEQLPKEVKEQLPKEVKEQLPKEVKEQLPKEVKEQLPKEFKEQLGSELETSKEIEIGTKAVDEKKSRKKKVQVKGLPKDNVEGSQKSYKQLQSGLEIFKEVKIEMVEKRNAEQKDEPSYYNFFAKDHKIKRGMDVGLTSPKSEQLVALGTVQNVESGDYVEVLVNIVLKNTTILPQAQGRATRLEYAQSLCILWPRNNVTEPDISADHAGIISDMAANLKFGSKPKLLSESEDPQIGLDKPAKRRRTASTMLIRKPSSNNGDSQTGQEKTTKRRRTSNPTTRKSSSKKDSQANASMDNALGAAM